MTQWGTPGSANGQFLYPTSVAVDTNGVYVADASNGRIQQFTDTGTYLRQWGVGEFNNPEGVAVDKTTGDVYVADTNNNRIEKFDSTGTFLLAFGWGVDHGVAEFETCTVAPCQAGLCLIVDNPLGDGEFCGPMGLATDDSGNVYVADTTNNRIQKFTRTPSPLTKWGTPGAANGQFSIPANVAANASNVYVADGGNNRVQWFTGAGIFLSQWDGFNSPEGIAIDTTTGNLYVADTINNRVQAFDSTGRFLVTFGWGVNDGRSNPETCSSAPCQPGVSGSGIGQFNGPWGVAVDGSGNLYVVDNGNNRIQKFACR